MTIWHWVCSNIPIINDFRGFFLSNNIIFNSFLQIINVLCSSPDFNYKNLTEMVVNINKNLTDIVVNIYKNLTEKVVNIVTFLHILKIGNRFKIKSFMAKMKKWQYWKNANFWDFKFFIYFFNSLIYLEN